MTTTTRYEVLRYRGPIDAHEGQILGHDEIGRPYAVLDADYDETTDRTTVYLAYAKPEQITAHIAERQSDLEDNTERYLSLRAAGLVR